MNHTERIHHVAKQVRGLTREMAREAVERYFESIAQEMASGEWVTLPSIGRLQVVRRRNGGQLLSHLGNGQQAHRQPGIRLQACLRLSDEFKSQAHAHTSDLTNYPGSTRRQPGKQTHYSVSIRNQSGKEE